MVYGLHFRSVSGFDPKVDWEGKGGPPPSIPALNPAHDGGTSGNSYHAGLPVDGTNFPKWIKWTDPKGFFIPDFNQVPYLNVSAKAKQVIESLEPDVHQFFPVEYHDNGGNVVDTRYWFVPCNRLDSVDREHTNFVMAMGKWYPARDLVDILPELIPAHLDKSERPKLVFNEKAIGSHHIWRDKHIGGATCFLSNAMAELFKQEGLTGLELEKSKQESVA